MSSAVRQEAYKQRFIESSPDEWRQRTRRAQANFRASHPEKKSAWNKVYKAVRSGQLVRPDSCERCHKGCVPEASHDDYTKPLEVEWLCKSCHTTKDTSIRRRN